MNAPTVEREDKYLKINEFCLTSGQQIQSEHFYSQCFSGAKIAKNCYQGVVFANCDFFATHFESNRFVNCHFVNCRFSFSHLKENIFENCHFSANEGLAFTLSQNVWLHCSAPLIYQENT